MDIYFKMSMVVWGDYSCSRQFNMEEKIARRGSCDGTAPFLTADKSYLETLASMI